MNISATRRVSGSSGTRKNAPSRVNNTNASTAFTANEQNVEKIDVSNKVSVNADTDRSQERDTGYSSKQQQSNPQQLTTDPTFVRGAVEALGASGLIEENNNDSRNQKVNVYSNNQSMYDSEENAELDRRYSAHYVKHLYENNEPPEEFDELV